MKSLKTQLSPDWLTLVVTVSPLTVHENVPEHEKLEEVPP